MLMPIMITEMKGKYNSLINGLKKVILILYALVKINSAFVILNKNICGIYRILM